MAERLTTRAARAVIDQANVLAQLGGESRDPRLRQAHEIIARIEEARTKEAARHSLKPNPLATKIREFCGPCEKYIAPDRCMYYSPSEVRSIVKAGNLCWRASVDGFSGIMTPQGFLHLTKRI